MIEQKKLYISPTVVFEELEDEDLMLAESHTEETDYTEDTDGKPNSSTDNPGYAGEGTLPWDEGPDF